MLQENSSPPPDHRVPSSARVTIVRSSLYPELLSSMEEAALSTLREGGIAPEHIRILRAPGSFEIPLLCAKLAAAREVEGLVALGVIVQGETHHAAEIARACTDGLMHIQLHYHIPVGHGVLYVETLQQAKERCLGRGNKGVEAARSLLHVFTLVGEHSGITRSQ